MASEAAGAKAPPRVLVPIADGSEEIESVCIIDVLRRAGAEVTVASVHAGRQAVVCSRGVKITADALMEDDAVKAGGWDLIALPGGMPGAENLRDSAALVETLKAQREAGGKYAAICAAPAVVLHHHGLLHGDGEDATCHPAFADRLPACKEARVVVSGNVITSRGPGTAIEFALELVRMLFGEEKATAVRDPMIVA